MKHTIIAYSSKLSYTEQRQVVLDELQILYAQIPRNQNKIYHLKMRLKHLARYERRKK